ncbi:hypothetical protein EIN_380950 [Entamoeba invadens IP1]|uniref:Uncharacterized protein n=2 Tax=Entamoeba invadens TaxID=33085 RepID=A0A0A1UAN5_ENTIV|nr:hypothetical protein EIN_380950 [Entamoeba invadens IP1]ELP92138.1 hypothetical protein EIN_380950 [Entamoeba invadens IP1]|eukprot:XP_004258909.1 hypothetical protein EIN_380950 [Entamoeba invadens IP1]
MMINWLIEVSTSNGKTENKLGISIVNSIANFIITNKDDFIEEIKTLNEKKESFKENIAALLKSVLSKVSQPKERKKKIERKSLEKKVPEKKLEKKSKFVVESDEEDTRSKLQKRKKKVEKKEIEVHKKRPIFSEPEVKRVRRRNRDVDDDAEDDVQFGKEPRQGINTISKNKEAYLKGLINYGCVDNMKSNLLLQQIASLGPDMDLNTDVDFLNQSPNPNPVFKIPEPFPSNYMNTKLVFGKMSKNKDKPYVKCASTLILPKNDDFEAKGGEMFKTTFSKIHTLSVSEPPTQRQSNANSYIAYDDQPNREYDETGFEQGPPTEYKPLNVLTGRRTQTDSYDPFTFFRIGYKQYDKV